MQSKKVLSIVALVLLVVVSSLVSTFFVLVKTLDLNLEKANIMRIVLDKTIEVPIKTTLDIPLDASIRINEKIPVNISLPITLELTQKQLGLQQMVIELDSDVQIDGNIKVKKVIPFDSEITTYAGLKVPAKGDIPVDTVIPISQTVHIKQKMPVKVGDFAIPFKVVVPVSTHVQIDQQVKVQQVVTVPIDHVFPINLSQVIEMPLKKHLEPWLDWFR